MRPCSVSFASPLARTQYGSSSSWTSKWSPASWSVAAASSASASDGFGLPSGSVAIATLPLGSPKPSLAEALDAAATLHDAGLHFEVHELLEPYWVRASGEAKETLQGLIQVAVAYAHLANGNLRGARALMEEGRSRLHGRTLGLDLEPFAHALPRSLAGLTDLAESDVPPFPRARKE